MVHERLVCVHCRWGRVKKKGKVSKVPPGVTVESQKIYQKTYVCDECRTVWKKKNKRPVLTPLEKKRLAHSRKLSKFFKDRNISDELQKMVKRKQDTPIDDVAYIHVRGWISQPNMHPIIHSILNKRRKRLTVDDGDYLFRYREHKVLLEALGAGKKSMDWAKQLLESGFAGNVEATEMVVDGMSVAAARKAYGLDPGPDPVPVPIPDIDDDFDPDDDDNEDPEPIL
ncbi:MAG TPA: hypothetical protein EYQ15_01525 [Candidatus Poseidoniales archaeon]|nr:hypothetical protein [Candidatus Poseidoniales archaeon]